MTPMIANPMTSDKAEVGSNWLDWNLCPVGRLPNSDENGKTSRRTRSPPDYGGLPYPDGLTRRARSPPDYGGPTSDFVNFVTSGHGLNADPNFYPSSCSKVQDFELNNHPNCSAPTLARQSDLLGLASDTLAGDEMAA